MSATSCRVPPSAAWAPRCSDDTTPSVFLPIGLQDVPAKIRMMSSRVMPGKKVLPNSLLGFQDKGDTRQRSIMLITPVHFVVVGDDPPAVEDDE